MRISPLRLQSPTRLSITGFAILILIVGSIILLCVFLRFLVEFHGKLAAISANTRAEKFGGDDGTTFGFDARHWWQIERGAVRLPTVTLTPSADRPEQANVASP